MLVLSSFWIRSVCRESFQTRKKAAWLSIMNEKHRQVYLSAGNIMQFYLIENRYALSVCLLV